VKAIVIFLGPHQEGLAAAELVAAVETLDAHNRAAIPMLLATLSTRDLLRVKFFSFPRCAAN
jgi:hypothetical protein